MRHKIRMAIAALAIAPTLALAQSAPPPAADGATPKGVAGTPRMAAMPAAGLEVYKATPLPPLPELKGPMARPGSAWPGGAASGEILPPTAMPQIGSPLPGGAAPQALPTGPMPALPSAGSALLPGSPPAEAAKAPRRPALEATFSGRSPSISAGGRMVVPGGRLPKSDLLLASVESGVAVLSDGTRLEIGDEVPELSKAPSKKGGAK